VAVDYHETKGRFQAAIRQLVREEPEDIGEAALLAYAHWNPLIRHIFWKRVQVVAERALAEPVKRALDFGCGVAMPAVTLARAGVEVTAVDIDLGPQRRLAKRVAYPPIRFLEGPLDRLPLEPSGYDVVLALDVLEHVPDLEPPLARLHDLLRPGGRLIVSGPTESALYRLGRQLAGRRFTGVYHHRSVSDIRETVAGTFAVEERRTVLPALPLFEVFVARRS
jgi:2-polyprenyl-3-methyl-5-hydroxy-6-metoxy-1,4-benzoquinol methylase